MHAYTCLASEAIFVAPFGTHELASLISSLYIRFFFCFHLTGAMFLRDFMPMSHE